MFALGSATVDISIKQESAQKAVRMLVGSSIGFLVRISSLVSYR